tara:strand:- start:3576 stop:4016 length:441 start_codon:yes stop_codon:yes gene_type:complete
MLSESFLRQTNNLCQYSKQSDIFGKVMLVNVTKTFRFYDIFDNKENYYCDVTINVVEKISGGKPIYDISYKYDTHGILNSRAHPFFYSKNVSEEDKEGEIIYKNSMTDHMIEYLLMDKEEIEKICGNTYWVQYKIKIMESLINFWD